MAAMAWSVTCALAALALAGFGKAEASDPALSSADAAQANRPEAVVPPGPPHYVPLPGILPPSPPLPVKHPPTSVPKTTTSLQASMAPTTSATTTTTTATTTISTTELPTSTSTTKLQCYEHPNIRYEQKWAAHGRNFFDKFHFVQGDSNNGATDYLNRHDADRLGVAQAFENHAILRAGPRSETTRLKRTSAKIFSKEYWHYFLAAVRFTHVPYGCGVWPAFWTHAPTSVWPNGGELDVLEYANDLPSQTSFHTGKQNPCRLSAQEVTRPGCPSMPDLNNMNYDCNTSYPSKLGCAPNTLPTLPGALWAQKPGVMAVEWTPSFVKIFYIPEADLQKVKLEGNAAGAPEPDTWDEYLLSYYPFAASESREPGSCRNPWEVLWPQQLVFQIGFCGDWAGKVWEYSGSCANVVGPAVPGECRAVDPLAPPGDHGGMENDCCTAYVWDENRTYRSDEHFKHTAFWNFTWMKVWQQDGHSRRLRGQI